MLLVAMHCPDVDPVETIAGGWKINDTKVRYRLPLKSGPELGQ